MVDCLMSRVKRNRLKTVIMLFLFMFTTGCTGSSANPSTNEVILPSGTVDTDLNTTPEPLDYNKKHSFPTLGIISEGPSEVNTIKDLLGDEAYNNFAEACKEIELNVDSIRNFKRIDDWASGPRYKMSYSDTDLTVYMLESGYVSSINIGSDHIYEDGFEPESINGWIVDLSVVLNLKKITEEYVNGYLKDPESAIYRWFDSGTISNIKGYYKMATTVDYKNSAGNRISSEIRADYSVSEDGAKLEYFVVGGKEVFGKENVPSIERKAIESKISAKSENGILIIDGQLGDYGKLDEKLNIIFYYLPAGGYTVTALNKGMVFVTNPKNTEDTKDYTFSKSGDSHEIKIPDGYYVELMINTSVEFVPHK